MEKLLQDNSLVLMEGSIVEQLRRRDGIEFHPELVNALLIYDERGRKALGELYKGYIEIALGANLPFMMCTPTWRTNYERMERSQISSDVNADAVGFLQEIRDLYPASSSQIRIGGLIGCKYDCYRPEEGLSADEAERFHSWQIERLAGGGADFIIAETLPSIEEAKGMAKAMEKSGMPYFVSFVISRDGRMLDGTELARAVEIIDAETDRQPLGYMVNCAYPTFICADRQPRTLFDRLIGYLANASSLDHSELDCAAELHADDVCDWGEAMLELNTLYNVKVLGGCCGTGAEHLRYLVEH